MSWVPRQATPSRHVSYERVHALCALSLNHASAHHACTCIEAIRSKKLPILEMASMRIVVISRPGYHHNHI